MIVDLLIGGMMATLAAIGLLNAKRAYGERRTSPRNRYSAPRHPDQRRKTMANHQPSRRSA
jgi:hypothetical protein